MSARASKASISRHWGSSELPPPARRHPRPIFGDSYVQGLQLKVPTNSFEGYDEDGIQNHQSQKAAIQSAIIP